MGKRFWFASLLVAVLAVLLPVVGVRSRRQKLPRCALDGVAIVPIYRVDVVDADQKRRSFCCVRCADYWLAKEAKPPSAVYVTDEVSGKSLDAAEAFYVRSSIVTNAVTGNRVHVFEEQSDADLHAAQFRGRVLDRDERPLKIDSLPKQASDKP